MREPPHHRSAAATQSATRGPSAPAGEHVAATTVPLAAPLLLLLLLLFAPLPQRAAADDGSDDGEQPCPARIRPPPGLRPWVTEEGRLTTFEGFDVECDEGIPPLMPLSFDPLPSQCHYCNNTKMGVCSGGGLTILPSVATYPQGIEYFKVTGSSIEAIPAKAFEGLQLKHIAIDNNPNLRGNLDDMAFSDVKGLESLNITRSGLKRINFKWLTGLDELKILSLEDNQIEFGEESDFPDDDDTDSQICVSSAEWASEGNHSSSDYKTPLVPELLQLDLAKNNLRNLNQSNFEWLRFSKLQRLNLRGISISTVEKGALLVVSKTLRELDISDSTLYDANNLIRLLSSFCGNDSSLQDLGLACLGLNRIPILALKQVNHTLRYLSLFGNNFHTVDKFSFPVMSQLLELDLRYCNIKTIEVSAFKNLPRVKTLLLSNNRITNVDRIFSDLKSLEYLDFGHNLGLKTSQEDSDPSKVPKFTVANDNEELSVIIFPPSLRTLDLSYTKIEILGHFTFHGLSNLVNLSLCHCRLSSILNHSQPFADLKNLQILDMSGNPWLEVNMADWIFEGLDSLRELYLDSISNGKNYGYDSQSFAKSNSNSQFSKIPNLRLLSAKHNYIHTLSTSIFLPLTKLETLYLSNNHLISWDSPLFSNNKNLKTLTLHQNQISYISNVMLEEFTNLSEISLYGNPILCNCEVWKFAMLANKGYITVVDWKEVNSYMCIENSKILYESFDGNWSKECEQEDHTVNPREGNSSDNSGMSASTRTNSIVYVVIVTIFSTAVMVYFVQKKGKYVKYIGGLIKNFTVKSLMSDAKSNFSHAYNYDVFVSYCDHDRNWVLNELLPQLEMKNNRADDPKQPGPAFKVCLHERDFQVGSSIMDNIISCMDNSRMILLVVSSPFLRSQWCQFEMHIAQHRLLESRQDDLLLVLLEEIPRDKRPKTLHYLMTTKTYLLWNEEMRDIFWKRLRRAIKPNPSEKEKSISSFP